MGRPKHNEEFVYRAVEMGELEIDADGRIWRVAARRGVKGSTRTITVPCARRRAEHRIGGYLVVPVMIGRKKVNALAHRLVWRHFNGSIPDGLTINHKNGSKTDNLPSNLELATYSDQMQHAVHRLGYNPTANLPPAGTRPSVKTRRKLSAVVKKRWADGVYSKWPSDETRRKMSEAAKRRRGRAA